MTAGSKASPDRIDGWKSIGAHFGRDRTTAIRWARERALPVHRMPGGKNATVYALRHELDRWAESGHRDVDAPATRPDIAPRRRSWVVAIAALVAFAIGGVGWAALPWMVSADSSSATTLALPLDPVTADRFLKGRDLLADREAASIERAIDLLREVTRRDAGYGPGYAALAEALVLSREFGMRDDRQAFPEARAAARNALRLTPSLASAHRVSGFIAYWWDQDFAAAREYFERAIALAPADATGYFWYGNILADHGDSADALRHLRQARTMQPGSVPIQTDLAWALWSAGQDDEAIAELNDLARRHPDFSVVHDCLAIIRLADGDYAGYVQGQARVAELRQSETLRQRTDKLSQALAAGAGRAEKILLQFALADRASGENRTAAWAAFVASSARDRSSLLAILREAQDRGERWRDAGLVRRVRSQWPDDTYIQAALSRLAKS